MAPAWIISTHCGSWREGRAGQGRRPGGTSGRRVAGQETRSGWSLKGGCQEGQAGDGVREGTARAPACLAGEWGSGRKQETGLGLGSCVSPEALGVKDRRANTEVH